MAHTAKKSSNKTWAEPRKSTGSKIFWSIALTSGMLLFILKPAISKDNTELKAELTDILQTVPVKEWKMIENKQVEEEMAKFEMVADTIKDPYDQIRTFVNEADMDYFNQLKTHMETKDSVEQVRCKAVVYAILQDQELTQEQKEILALSQFEILARIPGSDYRFSKKSGERLTSYPNDQIYKDKVQRYYAYKTYLESLTLKEEIAKIQKDIEKEKEKWKNLDENIKNLDENIKNLDENIKNLDENIKNLDENIKNLERQIQLFEWLLNTYQNYKK